MALVWEVFLWTGVIWWLCFVIVAPLVVCSVLLSIGCDEDPSEPMEWLDELFGNTKDASE